MKSKLLDSAPEEAFDRFTQLAIALLDIPMSLVTFVDQDRQFFKSYYGLPEPWASRRQTPLSHSLCQYVVASRQPLIVQDARKVAELKQNLAIPELGMVAYLGFPLLVEDHALGSFCAADTKPHAWSQREVRIVQALANYVNEELALRIETRERQGAFLQELASFVDAELAARFEDFAHQKPGEQPHESEERFHILVNQAPIIIWQTDTYGAITFLNTAWTTFTGLTREESVGGGWLVAIHPEDRTNISAFWKWSRDLRWFSPIEVRVQRADGVYREMICHGSAYTNDKGRFAGYIGTLFNITERRELERHWETFLGIVAHELKAPLTAIQGNIQLAQRHLKRMTSDVDDLSVQKMQEMLTQVMKLLARNLEHLQIQTRQINELQDFARVQVAQLDFRMAPCDLVEFVRRVVRDQQVSHPQRIILFESPGEIPILVSADEQRLQQVLTNYLSNAFKYSSPEQPVQVGITLGGGFARVWVRDYGIGLSPEQQEQIWKPFSRVQEITAQVGLSGLGLGLHICKALIQGQYGHVGVESAPGKGTIFWFELPLLPA